MGFVMFCTIHLTKKRKEAISKKKKKEAIIRMGSFGHLRLAVKDLLDCGQHKEMGIKLGQSSRDL